MTKLEYMNNLKDKLQIFDEALAKEIIEDYESHFCEGIENGKSEDDVSKELGDIDEIVAELELLYKTLPIKHPSINTIDIKEPKFNISIEFSEEPSPDETAVESISNNSIMPQFMNTDTATDGFTNNDTAAINLSDYENDTDTYEFHDDLIHSDEAFGKEQGTDSIPVKKLILESDCAEVNINPSRDGNFLLNYNNDGSMKQKMMYRFYGNQKGDTFYGRVLRENGVGKFFNFSTNPCIVIDVFLPKNMDLVEIKGISGDIEIRGASADDIKINTASGDINIQHLNCKNIDAVSLSGDIEADSINCGYLNLVSKSGDVSIKNGLINKSIIKSLSGSIDIHSLKGLDAFIDTTSGDIEVKNLSAEDVKLISNSGDISFDKGIMESLTIKTMSGDISVNSITTEKADLQSVSGDIGVHSKANSIYSKSTSGDIDILNESSFNGNINSISGEINIKLKNNSMGYKASVSTVSGEIDLRLVGKGYRINPRSGAYVIGNGEGDIKAKSMSGDICISG